MFFFSWSIAWSRSWFLSFSWILLSFLVKSVFSFFLESFFFSVSKACFLPFSLSLINSRLSSWSLSLCLCFFEVAMESRYPSRPWVHPRGCRRIRPAGESEGPASWCARPRPSGSCSPATSQQFQRWSYREGFETFLISFSIYLYLISFSIYL